MYSSAIVHFWFVSIHPFEDGNGRLARILSDMLLARGEKSEFRFYNVSSQIKKDKNHYYDILERMQHGDGDITEWLVQRSEASARKDSPTRCRAVSKGRSASS